MNVLSSFKNINTFIFDVDGVFTDGSILVLESGEMARLMNTKDGYAIQLAIKKGYKIFVVSGAARSAVEKRLNYLGVTEIFFSVKDKKAFVLQLMQERGLEASGILFMGDDIPDLPVFDIVNASCCPADAVTDVRQAAKYISDRDGGRGCVRDVIEKVLKINGHWDTGIGLASK
ncbi:MAG: 3-deoxy-D-manno-octulosonate 8-phosphate phosphatase [Niabella sp.]